MQIDHLNPEARGGLTHEANLCLACILCNRSKRDYVTGIDPLSGNHATLFNPRTQHWKDHFQWDDSGTLMIGLTPVGRATIARLKINRAAAVTARQSWVKVGWHPPKRD
jgi:hypothetical protein